MLTFAITSNAHILISKLVTINQIKLHFHVEIFRVHFSNYMKSTQETFPCKYVLMNCRNKMSADRMHI